MAKLKWRDSEDVYKPISRSLKEFLQEKQPQISQRDYGDSEALYRQLSNNRMSVFVQPEAEDELIRHLSFDPYNETGGVLVGQAYFCQQKKIHYTEIVGSIAAPYTVGNRVHFQFTPECWQAILSTQKQDFPETTIVGWYHSHPGHGIFLSGTDLNTQRLCFKQIWQIAVVYDPLRREIGFFYGADGKRIDAIYLQEISQATASPTKPQQLEWRQPEPQLPALPPHASVQVHNSVASDEQPLQDSNQPITEQTQTRGQNQNLIIRLLQKLGFLPKRTRVSDSFLEKSNVFLIIILVIAIVPLYLLTLLILNTLSVSAPPKSQPLESQPPDPQPGQSQPRSHSNHSHKRK